MKIWKIFQYIAAVFFLLIAVVLFTEGGFGILGGIVLLIAAFIISPFAEKIPFFKGRKVLPIISSVILMVVGICMSPSASESDTRDRTMPNTEMQVTTADTSSVTTAISEKAYELTSTVSAASVAVQTTCVMTTESQTATETTATTAATTATVAVTTTRLVVQTTVSTTCTTVIVTTKEGRTYILNNNTMKFHDPCCSSCDKIKEENKGEYFGTRDELIAKHYEPCGICKP